MSGLAVALVRSAIARQFMAFAAVGAVGTGVHYATLIAGVSLGLDPVTASGTGWCLGAIANYLLNYHFTFRSSLAHRHSLPRFALISGTGLLLNTLLMVVGTESLALHYLVAQVIATGTTLCWNFVFSRIWAFKASARSAASRELMVDTQAVPQIGAQPALRYLKSAAALWLGAAVIVAGGAGLVTSVTGWRAARIAERSGLETQAAITARPILATSSADTSTRYLALYRFTTNDGTRFGGSQVPPIESCEHTARRERVAVCYLPAESADAPAQPDVPRWVWPLFSGVAGALAVLGVTLTRPGLRRLRTIWRVQRSGVDARATVIDVAPIYTRRDRAPHWRIRYEFSDGLGRRHAGNSELMSRQQAVHWSVGDGAAVRFDPHAPHDNCWLGMRV